MNIKYKMQEDLLVLSKAKANKGILVVLKFEDTRKKVLGVLYMNREAPVYVRR